MTDEPRFPVEAWQEVFSAPVPAYETSLSDDTIRALASLANHVREAAKLLVEGFEADDLLALYMPLALISGAQKRLNAAVEAMLDAQGGDGVMRRARVADESCHVRATGELS